MIKIEGKANITVKVVADSISPQGIRLTTYELTYPRIIHSELLTHGMLVRNAASSRAIPFAKMVEQLQGRPVRFGQANPGMQDKGEDYDKLVEGEIVNQNDVDNFGWTAFYEALESEEAWERAKNDAIKWSKRFYDAGYHKQVYNRITEPFQMMKTVLSCTEDKNFFWLRKHGAADPTLEELAQCMWEAKKQSVPCPLCAGEYHLPYVETYQMLEFYNEGTDDEYQKLGRQAYFIGEGENRKEITLEQAIKVSCARTAAVSFRNEDYGLEKCLEVYDRLVGDERKHASAMQHQATPIQETYEDHGWSNEDDKSCNLPFYPDTWESGVSHVDRDGQLWSAQFKGWIMYRKLIPGENYTGDIE